MQHTLDTRPDHNQTAGPINAGRLAYIERHGGHAVSTMPALLTDKQAAALLGISERKFHELRSLLPKPVVLGPRCVRWLRSELEQAILMLPRQEEVAAPAQLARAARARIERLKSGAAAAKTDTARTGA